jgi:hypothetical protein
MFCPQEDFWELLGQAATRCPLPGHAEAWSASWCWLWLSAGPGFRPGLCCLVQSPGLTSACWPGLHLLRCLHLAPLMLT